jgi:chromosome segregation ATPase
MSETTVTTPVRQLTEAEAYAIAAAEVKRETAALQTDVERLTAEVTDLQSKFDIEVSARTAAEAARDAAVKVHEDYLADLDAQREAASKKDERVTKIREAASHLKDEFFADESRIARITSMKDEEFEGYLADLRETASLAPAPKAGETPRETAMAGSAVTGGEAPAAAASAFLLRPFVAPKEA